ncbi:MAG TPA: transaldolase family protein, partial [Nitrososphaeraceae archaeon]|nr:transaldolase family protein [Nitrososphaeraceae archaeon]
MKIFLDTASIESIKKFVDMGIVDGITTNPTLISREKGHPEDIMRGIVKIVKGPVNLEVVATNSEEMIEEGLRLKKFGENVIVKVPMTSDGLKAVRKLAENKIKTNVTLIFSSNQALLAAKAGASYVSPFIGRLDDAGQEGMTVIKEI